MNTQKTVNKENLFCNQNLQKALKNSGKIVTSKNNKLGSFLIYPLFKKYTIIYTNAKKTPKVKSYLKKLAKKYNVIYALHETQEVIDKFETKSFKEFIPRATRIISLSESKEEILSQMHAKGRYNCKVAQKNNLKISTKWSLEDFYKLLEKTAKRDNFFINNKKYYQELFENIPSKQIHFYGIYKDSNLIAASIVIDHANTAYYFYGASDHDYRNLMAPYLIQHKAIFEAQKRGMQFYDFLGISPYSPHPLDKVSEFKRKFGGKIIHFKANKLTIFKPGIFFILMLRKKIKNFFKKS